MIPRECWPPQCSIRLWECFGFCPLWWQSLRGHCLTVHSSQWGLEPQRCCPSILCPLLGRGSCCCTKGHVDMHGISGGPHRLSASKGAPCRREFQVAPAVALAGPAPAPVTATVLTDPQAGRAPPLPETLAPVPKERTGALDQQSDSPSVFVSPRDTWLGGTLFP